MDAKYLCEKALSGHPYGVLRFSPTSNRAFKSKFKFSSSAKVTEAEVMGKPRFHGSKFSVLRRFVLDSEIEYFSKIVAV